MRFRVMSMPGARRFVLLRGTHAGPAFLARPDQPDDADAWTTDRDDAKRFDDRAEAEAAQAEIVARTRFAIAVVLFAR